MIAMTERDDLRVSGIAAGELDCSLVRFRPTVGKERLGQLPVGRDLGEPRGEIDIKGKGRMATYFLTGKRAVTEPGVGIDT